MIKEFKTGTELGRKHLAKIGAMSDRWKTRNVPVYIRTSLLVPYYIVEQEGCFELWVIQFPLSAGDKVHFIPFARSTINEEEHPEISDRKK